jgi:hypothetical protein
MLSGVMILYKLQPKTQTGILAMVSLGLLFEIERSHYEFQLENTSWQHRISWFDRL